MKNLFGNLIFYYALILTPLLFYVAGMKYGWFSWGQFVVFIFGYGLVYRPYVDFKRLEAKGVVSKFRYFDMLFMPMRYFKELYWV